MMTDLLPNLGKPTMKSIEIFIEIVGGSGSGWSLPGGLTVSPLLHWHVSHSVTKVRMSYFISSQKKYCLTRS
jgi:hypothetical protein